MKKYILILLVTLFISTIVGCQSRDEVSESIKDEGILGTYTVSIEEIDTSTLGDIQVMTMMRLRKDLQGSITIKKSEMISEDGDVMNYTIDDNQVLITHKIGEPLIGTIVIEPNKLILTFSKIDVTFTKDK